MQLQFKLESAINIKLGIRVKIGIVLKYAINMKPGIKENRTEPYSYFNQTKGIFDLSRIDKYISIF